MSSRPKNVRVLSVLTQVVGGLAMAGAVAAGPTTRPGGPPTSGPEVYSTWPFSAAEAVRRQEATARALGQPKEMTLDLGNNVTMKLALIPAGKFLMGSADAEQRDTAKIEGAYGIKIEHVRKWLVNESPQHEVIISKPFYLGVYTVTQEQYEQVMGRNPSHFKSAQNPVDTLSWDDAAEFCRKVSAKAGAAVRLPTEAQWEYACRAGTETPFNTGSTITTDQANYDGTYAYGGKAAGENRQKTTPVGSFKPNAFGLYDMHGNVWQWCADWYESNYYAASPKADPTGPAEGTLHVQRGGAWYIGPWDCRSASRRRWLDPAGRFVTGGFRVAVATGAD